MSNIGTKIRFIFIFTGNRNGVDNLKHNIKSGLEHFFTASWTFFDIGLAISTNNVSIFTKDGKIRRVGNLELFHKKNIYFDNSKRPKKKIIFRNHIHMFLPYNTQDIPVNSKELEDP